MTSLELALPFTVSVYNFRKIYISPVFRATENAHLRFALTASRIGAHVYGARMYIVCFDYRKVV